MTGDHRMYLLGIGTLALLLGFALYVKGDVKAGFKLLGFELSIEAKEPARPASRPTRKTGISDGT